MSGGERTAAELVARVRAGRPGAEEEIYERYRRGITMILQQRVGSPPDVEDLFQETFRLGFEKIRQGELREPARLPQFLNSLARNLSIQHFRKEEKHRGGEDLDRVERTFEVAPGQFERLARQEKADLALSVLRELRNERDREILFRFYIAEEEKSVICEHFGLSSLHFNRVLHRARLRYRELYEGAAAQR